MNIFKFMPAALIATAAITFTACDDDDEPKGNGEPNIDNVFGDDKPAAIDGCTITKNDKGQVTAIADGSVKTTFEYGSFTPASRAHNFTVLMKQRDTDQPDGDGTDYYLELNAQGFVTYAYAIDANPDPDDEDNDAEEWIFEYNKDGQMTYMNHIESIDNWDKFNITYANGDITKVVGTEDDGDVKEYVFTYTNDTYKTPVANKGCIMLYEDAFQVNQLDNMEIAYYAGLLGKASKNLPMGYTRSGVEGGDKYTDDPVILNWEFNADKLPVKFWVEGEEWENVTFKW